MTKMDFSFHILSTGIKYFFAGRLVRGFQTFPTGGYRLLRKNFTIVRPVSMTYWY
jgi:hypothetical protein